MSSYLKRGLVPLRLRNYGPSLEVFGVCIDIVQEIVPVPTAAGTVYVS